MKYTYKSFIENSISLINRNIINLKYIYSIIFISQHIWNVQTGLDYIERIKYITLFRLTLGCFNQKL
jgi:hypothetical protein